MLSLIMSLKATRIVVISNPAAETYIVMLICGVRNLTANSQGKHQALCVNVRLLSGFSPRKIVFMCNYLERGSK